VAKRKQQGNGSGTVYPRRNRVGKITSYLGSYFAPDGKRKYVSARTKTACRQKLRRAMSYADEGFVFDAGKQSVGHRKRQLKEKLKARSCEDPDLVFATGKGTPLDAQNIINRHFKPLLKRTGLPNIRWHDLRHTCATLLLGRGVHPKLVQHLLGTLA
jgi:hypothetical protein